jgi:hypothetical protein
MEHVLAAPTDVGVLGVYHLKRLWSRVTAGLQGQFAQGSGDEAHLDSLVIQAVGLGLEQAMQYFASRPTFEAFERWIVATTGGISPSQVARINAAVVGAAAPEDAARWIEAVEKNPPVLLDDDLAFWETNGYVVVHDAVSPAACAAAARAIWEHVGADPDDPESWYCRRDHGIMVQYFQHPAFEANRRSPRIHKAFAQLWGTADLWVSTDRVGFNVPERPGWMFPGPDLHFDVSLAQPIPFDTGGILYLTDTPPEQGAFTCVPGFQHRVGEWLAGLPPGANPRQQDLHALGSQPIGGRAGDLVIWHQALPHGSRPNRGTRPRLVQYVRWYPRKVEIRDTWL